MMDEKHSVATFIERLEDFAVDFGLLLAGWIVNGPDELIPFDREQIAVLMIASIGAHARTLKELPDYDGDADITNVVQLGLHAYAEATKANLVAAMDEIADSADQGDMSPLDNLDFGHELETMRESYGDLVTDVEYPDGLEETKEHAAGQDT